MGKQKYTIEFLMEDTVGDLSRKIKRNSPTLTEEESLRLAHRSLERINITGQKDLYDGLLDLGSKYAEDIYKESENREPARESST
jgi:hypothetical protein